MLNKNNKQITDTKTSVTSKIYTVKIVCLHMVHTKAPGPFPTDHGSVCWTTLFCDNVSHKEISNKFVTW